MTVKNFSDIINRNNKRVSYNINKSGENDDIQIIIVSANRMVMDKVDGLDLGADDYIEKPFDILELMSRVNSKARRFYKKQRMVLGDFILDLRKHEFYKNNELIGNEVIYSVGYISSRLRGP